jgi:hypothetical protein
VSLPASRSPRVLHMLETQVRCRLDLQYIDKALATQRLPPGLFGGQPDRHCEHVSPVVTTSAPDWRSIGHAGSIEHKFCIQHKLSAEKRFRVSRCANSGARLIRQREWATTCRPEGRRRHRLTRST